MSRLVDGRAKQEGREYRAQKRFQLIASKRHCCYTQRSKSDTRLSDPEDQNARDRTTELIDAGSYRDSFEDGLPTPVCYRVPNLECRLSSRHPDSKRTIAFHSAIEISIHSRLNCKREGRDE